MENSKQVKPKVESTPTPKVKKEVIPEKVMQVKETATPFTKSAQANPKSAGKATVKPVEKPKVEPPPPIVIQPPIEQKAEVVQTKAVDTKSEVAKWLSPDLPLNPTDFMKIASNLASEIDVLKKDVSEIKELLAKKRKPAANGNGRVQIKDTKTGVIYKSKNNVYQTLLRGNELTELISQGVFGTDPKKNSFGWYALNRAFPGRFEEIKSVEAPECK